MFGPMGQEVTAGEENYIMRTAVMCTSSRQMKTTSVPWNTYNQHERCEHEYKMLSLQKSRRERKNNIKRVLKV